MTESKEAVQVVPQGFPDWFLQLLEACCGAHKCKVKFEQKNDLPLCIICRKTNPWEEVQDYVLRCTSCGYSVPKSIGGQAPVITGGAEDRRACIAKLIDNMSEAKKRHPDSESDRSTFMKGAAKEVSAKAVKPKRGNSKVTTIPLEE